jgi:hypothetical protein
MTVFSFMRDKRKLCLENKAIVMKKKQQQQQRELTNTRND